MQIKNYLILLLIMTMLCIADCKVVLAGTATAQATATVVSSYQQLRISKDRELWNGNIEETTSSLRNVLSIKVDTDTAWSIGMRHVNTSNVPVIIRDSEQIVIENDVELTHKVGLIFAGGTQSCEMSWEILMDPLLFLDKTEKLHSTQLEIILFAH